MSEPRLHPDRIARSSRQEIVLGLIVVLALVLVAVMSTTAINGSPVGPSYEVRVTLPSDGPVLRRGADARIAGTRVGVVRSVALDDSGRRAVARVELSDARLGRGATGSVRVRGFAGPVYLELDPGDRAQTLPSGARIGAPASRSGTQLSEVVAGFDADARRALGRTLAIYGAGSSGRGAELNRALATLPGLLHDSTSELDALARNPGELGSLLDDASAVAGAAADGDLGGATAGLRGTVEPLGRRRAELTASIRALPGVEREAAASLGPVDGLLTRLSTTATSLRPVVSSLVDALPSLVDAERKRGGLRELATVARRARPAVRPATPLVEELRGTAVSIGPLSNPLLTLSQKLVPYSHELIEAPAGFSRWGGFTYPFGVGKGHKAVRFSMILTCAGGRRAYPDPGQALGDAKACP